MMALLIILGMTIAFLFGAIAGALIIMNIANEEINQEDQWNRK
jgi:uncharacterized protein YneF (UPF0154 family)